MEACIGKCYVASFFFVLGSLSKVVVSWCRGRVLSPNNVIQMFEKTLNNRFPRH